MLLNLGNTCAINSLIQSINLTNIDIQKFNKPNNNTLSKSLFELLYLIQNNPDKNIKPSKFIETLYNKLTEFQRFQQLDAQELWILMSNKIFEETAVNIDLNKSFTNSIHEKAFNDLNRHNNNKDCLWNQIFQGSIVNILTCKNCENKSLSFEPFYSLNMTPDISITEMFREYFKKENIENIDCEKCLTKTKHTKIVKFYKLPKFLILSINRYNENKNKKIEVNPSLIFSSNILIDNKKKLEINLVSTVNHYGSMNNGHYTCLNIKENKVIDDETIIKTDCNNLFKNNNNIYMLFYKIDFVI